ncbi:unnamed protein product [Blepharisma stoltei]|uniref:Uncharacterized protein n=1 Tax=Blepharisma stoltei TaxID=1481888 RepID=A0AAU9IKK4_9CILI|nr:unnamed protein product [Blepharisma stoltei]
MHHIIYSAEALDMRISLGVFRISFETSIILKCMREIYASNFKEFKPIVLPFISSLNCMSYLQLANN